MRLTRQFAIFSSVGVLATAVHYVSLILLVESGLADPVEGNLAGFLLGGIISYSLSRRYAFQSQRAHVEAIWRFVLVAGVGFCLTGIFTYLFSVVAGLPYLIAAMMTSSVVLSWNFTANRLWTFRSSP
jgi:putative flippase GtrA